MEPITTLAASAIAKLAFDEFIKSGAGELAKKSVEGTGNLIKVLQEKIQLKFEDDEKAKTSLSKIKQQKTSESLDELTKYLNLAMAGDEAFANEVQKIAHQIINIQKRNQSNTDLKQQNNNYGRDQIILNQPQGDIKLGG
jgi:hypothetical protein